MIAPVSFSNKAHVARRDQRVALVEQMLALHKSPAGAKAPHDQESLQRPIDATVRRICPSTRGGLFGAALRG